MVDALGAFRMYGAAEQALTEAASQTTKGGLPMSCLVIRCRSCAPVSNVELTDWLEEKVAELRKGTPRLLVRLTRLTQDLPEASVDDGWLIEVELQGERPEEPFASLMASLPETLGDMRILGLNPTLLVPVRLPFGEPPLASAGFASSDELFGGAADASSAGG